MDRSHRGRLRCIKEMLYGPNLVILHSILILSIWLVTRRCQHEEVEEWLNDMGIASAVTRASRTNQHFGIAVVDDDDDVILVTLCDISHFSC